MHYKSEEVKNMKAAEIRRILAHYIEDIQPRVFGKNITDDLLSAIQNKSMDICKYAKSLMADELIIANKTGDYRIHDMLQYLRQVDRHVKKNKTI